MKFHGRKISVFLHLHREVKNSENRYSATLLFFFLLLPSLYLTILTMLSVWGKWNKYSLSDNKYFQISGDVLNRMLKHTGWLKERLCLKGVKGSSIHSSYGHVVPLNGLKGTSGCD